MIRLIYVLRRKPNLSLGEFQKYWREQHGPLVARYATDLDILRYVQVHTLEDPLNDGLAGPRSCMPPYDGVAELWWSSRDSLIAASMSEAGQAAGAALVDDEKKFIDVENSPLWFAYDYPQVNPVPEDIVATEKSPLLKLFYVLRHLPSLTLDEMQFYWRTTHGPKIRAIAQAARILRYVQVHRCADELEEVLRQARSTKEETFAGHAELWFDRAALMAALTTPEGLKAFEIALDDEKNFIDFSRSALWFGKEHVMIDRR